jgi:creatinine amidohydrolase
MYSTQQTSFDVHGGDYETSLMLTFPPDTVDMSQAQDFCFTAEASSISPISPISFGWIASDLNPRGVVSQAHLATAEKGHAKANKMVTDVITLLRKVVASPLDGLSPVTPPF